MSLKHPVERGSTDRRRPFDRFAQRASHFASSGLFFGFCVLLVLAWVGGYVFGAGSAYEQVTGTALTAMTLLLIALLQNAELRAEHAIQVKLDALATAMLEGIRQEGAEADAMLEQAIGREEHV
ncbi:MAG TPA: low affinity iron permease family protein [Solirubrobacteraceae bacterium]|nr:low affinity iron permease family protein [Solirubrobacteraceae bacterium]